MKRQISFLIMVLMLLPIALVFVACGKDKSYNLNHLKSDYNKIADENNNVQIIEGKLQFVYSDNVQNLQTKPYNALHDYNLVLNNLMSFTNDYIVTCSNNTLTKDAKLKNNVRKSLKDFENSVKRVNSNVNTFSEIVDIVTENNKDLKSASCLIRYENLLVAYDELFESASNLNNVISKLYFNYVLNEKNPNVSEISLENFDSTLVINKLKGKISYLKSLLSESFVEMYIDGGNLAKKIASEEIEFDINKYQYKQNIESISRNFDEISAISKINGSVSKQDFYLYAVQAYNIQEMIFNDVDKFITAVNKVNYSIVKSNPAATAYENLCVKIIESNQKLVADYTNVLSNMLTIMGV